jgi:hypothetical protein
VIFTILDDGHDSLICNDCITEDQLDYGYSETELGSCDECGVHGKRLWPSLPSVGIIIGLSMMQVEAWARMRGLAGSDQIRLYGTDNDHGGPTLEGMRVEPECVALLPGAERGRRWYLFEQELMMARGLQAQSITSAKIASGTLAFQLNITNNTNFQQYAKMLYGTQPTVKLTGVI